MITKYYNKILSNTNVRVLAVHPGIVDTDLFNGTLFKMMMPWILKYICKVRYNSSMSIVFYIIFIFHFRIQKKDLELLLMLVFLQN